MGTQVQMGTQAVYLSPPGKYLSLQHPDTSHTSFAQKITEPGLKRKLHQSTLDS